MDDQNFDPSFGKSQDPFSVKVATPEIKVVQPKFDVAQFEDKDLKKAREDGSVQFASGVVRVNDAPTYNLPEVNKSLYGEKLGVTRASELRAAVGLKENESFTEYYKTNKFVPSGFDIDAKILLREEKIKGLEQQVAQGTLGYQSFLYKAYGEDLLKADGHDVKSSLYWYNRRKQGMLDSPIDNTTYLTSLLQQAETLYRNELWYAESNTMSIQNSFLGQMGDKNKLPSDKIRDLFSEQFKQLDAMVESDEEKIRLYKAGLLRGFNPTVDENGDGKVDWYLHRDGNVYRVKQAGSDGPDTKAVSYYNEDGTLDRIEVDGMFGVYADQFVQGFGGAIAGIADLFVYGTVGIADTIENIFTGNWEYDKLADVYKEIEGFKASTYLLGNNVYSTSTGWTNSDGTIDGDGIGRGVARGIGTLAGMLALSAVGGGLANFGVAKTKILDQAGKQIVAKTITKNGILETGIRSIGNAINGVVGLSQGVYRAGSSSAVLTATQATVRGLGYLAVKDFTTTVGSLSASKDLLGMTDEEIIGKSLTMTGLNFGLSFLLRSVGNTPATTRLASFWKAKFQKTAEIKAAGALDDTFADALLRWAGDASKRKSFVFVNSAMDVAENMLTMGTQTSLASTGKLFDKDAWSGLLDPQNLALQGWLFKNNVSGGLRGDDMQMGAAGVAAQLDNLNKVYNGDILGRMLATASEKAASKNAADVKAADTINSAVREANRIKDAEKNPALGIQKAIMYLHDTFKDEGDLSFVREAITKTYNKARTDEIILGTKAAIETYTNVVAAKTNIQKDALLKGDIFAPGSFISSKLTDKKVKDIQRIAEQFEGAIANMAKYSLVNKVSSFEILKQTSTKILLSNKKDFETVSNLAGVTLDSVGDLKFEAVEIKNKDGTVKTEYKITTPEGRIFTGENAAKLKALTETIGSTKGFAVVTLPTTGDAAGQSARLKVTQLLDTFVDIAKADASADVISPIYKLMDGTYVVPSFNDGVTLKNLTQMHGALANLYGVKYNVTYADKAKAFKNLFEVMEGKPYVKDKNIDAVTLINKLLTNGFVTIDEAAGLLNSVEFANIKTDASIDLKNFSLVNKALTYAKGIKLLEAYREARSNQTPTRDQGVVEKTQKEFMDYYTNELQSEPELQQLLAKRNGFSKNDLLNFIKENPLKDKDRLLSLFKTLSVGLGIKDDGSLDDQLRNNIVEQLIELTGIKEIVRESYPDAVLEGVRKVSSDTNTNIGKIMLNLISGVKSTQDLRSKILDLKPEDIKKAIEDNKARLVKQDGTAWTDADSATLESDIKKTYYNLKAEALKELLFNGQDDLLYQALLSHYDKINTSQVKANEADEFEEYEVTPKVPASRKLISAEVPEKTVVVTPAQPERKERVQVAGEQKVAFAKTPDNEQTYKNFPNQFKIVEINGKQFLQSGDNFLAIVEYNGVRIPFYWSAGNNPKDGVTPERWYYTAGYFEGGTKSWINKPSSEEIRNFGFNKVIRAMSEFLSDNVKVPTEGLDPFAKPTAEELAVYNEGLKPRRNIDTKSPEAKALIATFTQEEKQRLQQQINEPFDLIKPRIEALSKDESTVTKTIPAVPAVTRVIPKVEAVYQDIPEVPAVMGKRKKTKPVSVATEPATKVNLFNTSIAKITTNENGARDFIYEKLLSDPKFVEELFQGATETKHLEKALKLYEQTYIKDTIGRNSSGKIVLNVNELLGFYQTRFIDGLNNPYKQTNILEAQGVEEKLKQVFGEKYVDFVKGKLSIESFVAENIYHMYKDRLVAGNLEFKFSIVDGKIKISDPSELSALNKLLKDLGYELFDLQEGLDNIPGIYFKVQTSDAAIDLEFEKGKEGSVSPKALFLDGLRKNGQLSWDEASKDAYIANIDFDEAIINRTGNLNYIDENTSFSFENGKLPRFYGNLEFAVNERVKSIIDASPDINLKQGRNGGALFKAYFIARVLPGMLSDVDVALKRNVYVMDVIDVVDKFIKEKAEGASDKTFILSEVALKPEEIADFKNNGDLYDFEYVREYDDKTNRGYKVYIIKPKLDFKERAFKYIEANGKINMKYVMPQEMMASRTALEEYTAENKTTEPGSNIALANTSRLLTTNTTGYDLTNYISAYLRSPYSERFIEESYLGDVIFTKKGLGLEKKIIEQLKNRTYNDILKAGNEKVKGTDVLLKNTVYFEMLSRFLVGSKQLSDDMLDKFGIDANNRDLNILLADIDVRKIIGKDLQNLLRTSKEKPITDVNDSRLTAVTNKLNEVINKNKRTKSYSSASGYQVLQHGTEPDGKVSIDSYAVSSLGLVNKTIAKFTNEDVLSIYKAATTDGEFQAISSISKDGRVNKTVSKVYAITNTSDNKEENRVSIFVDDLYRLSQEDFTNVYQYLKNNGVKQSSLDVLQNKFETINKNSSFYQGLFRTNPNGDYVVQSRLTAFSGLPSAVTDNTIAFSFRNGDSAKKARDIFLENASKKPVANTNAASKSVKASAIDIDRRNPFFNLMSNLKNRIERDAETPMTGSRLVQNLQHYEFLGKLMYNVAALGKNVQSILEQRGIKIGVADATKIAFTIFNQSTGVTYDKFYSDIFFYDTKDNTIKAVTGSGNNAKGFGYVAAEYLKEHANKEPGQVIAFQVDKDALLSSSIKNSTPVKYFVLDNEKSKTLQELVNNFVFREIQNIKTKELPENPVVADKIAYVLGRYTNQSDRLDHIVSTLVKLKIPQQYARSLAKTLFFNGQNVLVGSNKSSLNATKTMNTLKLNDPNYRTSNAKENNIQRSLNDSLYFINVNDLPTDYLRELRVMASEYENKLSKDNNYRQDVVDTVRLILEKGTKHQDVLNLMEAFSNKQVSNDIKKQFLQDVTALYILKKNDGASHNFMLLDNNVNDLMIKATNGSKLDFLTQDGSKIDASRLLAEDFYVGDIENAWYKDKDGNEIPLVLELTLQGFKGVKNIEDFYDQRLNLETTKKETITIPAFYKNVILTEKVLMNETRDMPKESTREQRLQKLLPDYYESFYKKFGESSKLVWDNYFRNIEGVIKTYKIKDIKDVRDYIINKAQSLGYDGTKVLLSFNGKSHDFGSKDKSGVLVKAGYFSKDDSFFQNKHVDIFSDLYTSNRFEVDSYSDQQGMALVDIAAKLGIAYTNKHTSDADVKVTAEIAVKLLATVSNSNRFTSNILNVFEDLRTNMGLKETDITTVEQTSKLNKLNQEWLTNDTKDFITNYRFAFDEKNLRDYNKAFNTIVNSLKDYLDTVEKEVKRKQVRELVREELGRKFDFFEKVQKNSDELASIFEYFILKQERFTKDSKQGFNKENLITKKADETGQEYATKSGFLKLYDLLKEVFGDEYESEDSRGNVETYRSLSALGLEKIFSLDPKELFEMIAAKRTTVPGYQLTGIDVSYKDYLANKDKFTGTQIRQVVEELKQDGTLASINAEEQSYRLLNKFSNNYDTMFGSIVEGLDKNIQDIILNEAATPYLKNLSLSDKQYAERIKNRGLKLDDSKFAAALKKLIKDSSFGTTFHYNAFFEQANQADYNKRYQMENGNLEFVGANEIGITAKKYEELTGLSYENAKALFKVNEGGSVYLNIMRHPVDKIGSIASLKVKILADTPENNRYTTLINPDMLYAVLAGDVDGDYITIVSPSKGMVEFNRQLSKYLRKGNDLIGQAIRGLTNPKLVNESQELKLALTYDRTFAERAVRDRTDLIEGKVSFEERKKQRLAELKALIDGKKVKLDDKQLSKLLDKIWLQEFDLSVFLVNVNRKVYYSSNRFLNDDANSKAFKELSFARTRNFGAQAIADTGSGYYANLTNRVGEKIQSKDAKFILNYSAFGLTDFTQDFINENLPAFKVSLLEKVKLAYDNKELFIDEQDYNVMVKLINDSTNAIEISSVMNRLDSLMFESKEFGDAYVQAYKSFKDLDKDILSSNEKYNINLLSEYAKSLGIVIEDAFDLAKIQETLYEKLADYSTGNFWSSSGASGSRKQDLLRGLEELEQPYRGAKSRIDYHEKVAGIQEEDGFRADLHSNVIIVMDKNKFADSMPITDADTYMYVKEGVNNIRMVKAYNYSLNALDFNLANKLIGLRDGNQVVKQDIELGNGNVIPKGFKIIQIETLNDGSYKVLASYETGFQPGTKVVVPGTKAGKATNGGEVQGSLAKVIKDNKLEIDFVYGTSSFDYKNITPLVGKFFKESQIEYFKYDEKSGKTTKVDKATDADFAILKELPMKLTQTFFEGRIKENSVDDITLSTSKRNIFGNVLFGNTFIDVDKNDPTKITFNSERIADGARALDVLNQPTLIGNNAAFLHGTLINSIALKYSGLSKAEQSKRLSEMTTNYDMGSTASIANFWYLIQTNFDNNIENLLSKATDIEKIILSSNLYRNFFNETNGRILESADDLIQKSKNAGFERQLGPSGSTLRSFKPEGEMGRHLAKRLNNSIFSNKYNNSLVFDNTFGYMGMIEYLNFIINSNNQINKDKPGFKPMAFITSKDATDASLLNILNVGKGIGGSLYEGFSSINLRDALIEQNPETYGLALNNQKTGLLIKGVAYEVGSSKIAPSAFSEVRKHNDFKQTETDYTNRLSSNNRKFDTNQNKYVFDAMTARSNVNTNSGDNTVNTNLRNAEVRFLKYLLGSVGKAKDIYDRIALFGYNDRVYAPLSVTGISINSNDNRMSLGYDNEFITTDVRNADKAIQEKINSRRFLDLFEFKSKTLKDSIEQIVKKDPKNVALTSKIAEKEIDRVKSLENLLVEKQGFERNSKAQNLWNDIFKEEVPLDNDDIKFRQRVFFESNKQKLTAVFGEDLLRSGLFKIVNGDSGLTIEVERAVRDYLIEPKLFEKQFTQPLKDLFDFASSLGVSEKLNHYAAAKYYVYAIQKIEASLKNPDIKDNDKSSLKILLDTYKQDFADLKTGFATPKEFMDSFENIYGVVVKEFDKVNSYLGVQFKQYSIMTDEASDSLFYLLKPNVRKGLEKEEKTFMRLSMFTYNDEREYDGVDLASYNYFDDLHTKLIMLSKQAATVKLSNKLKSLGLMANLPVKDYLMKNVREQLETAAEKFVVYGPKGKELEQDVLDFVDDIDNTLVRYFGLPKVKSEVYGALVNGRVGIALYNTFNVLEEQLAKQSNGMSKEQAMIQYRSSKPGTDEHNKAIGILNLYEFQNQALIMLTNRIDKDVLNAMYTSLKAEATRNGTVLTDRFGRILHEDPRDYKLLFAGSTEAVKHLVKYSSYSGGYEKNIILDALNGDVFFANKSLAESLDKNFFTTKTPNKVIQSIAKLNGLVSKLIMSNPFRYLDRLLGFTLYDVATLGSFEPKTFAKLPNAINQISAFLQSKYSVMSPELKEFLTEAGIDLKKANFSELFSGFDQNGLLDKLINPIAEPLGKGFNIQNIVGRFSYWMAVKENLDNNKPVNYGPSLSIKESVEALQGKADNDGVETVSANGRKAYFLMTEILGAPGDFPILARKLKGLAMFTTFPLAAARFTRGLLGSASTALKELFIGDNKQVALRWLTSTGLGMAGLFAVPWLIFELWGNVMGLSEEEKEEWKEQGDGMPEFVRSVFTGSPVINKFNTFNQYALIDSMTFKPFREAMDEGGTIIDGAGRWLLDNVASRGPAPLKLTAEVLGGFDSFGGTIQDTSDQWSMWENFQRKVAAYVIGGSGANALTTYLNKDLKYNNDSFAEMFVNGFRVVIEAEMGNTSAFKTDIKNYYRANNLIQTARFANENDTYYTSSNFDTDTYNDVKSEIGRAMRRKAKPSVIYGIIMDAMKEGVGLPEIRSALRNNSLEYKLSKVPDLGEFYSNLNESDFKTINDAIAYERQTYPFLNDLVNEVNDLYSRANRNSNYTPRVYIPRVYNRNNYKTNYSYNYNNFVRNSRYNNLFKIYDPYKAYRASWFKVKNLDKELK